MRMCIVQIKNGMFVFFEVKKQKKNGFRTRQSVFINLKYDTHLQLLGKKIHQNIREKSRQDFHHFGALLLGHRKSFDNVVHNKPFHEILFNYSFMEYENRAFSTEKKNSMQI